jgi:hypothetical protein
MVLKLNEISGQVIQLLKSSSAFSDVNISELYPASGVAVPLERCAAAVGITGAEVYSNAFEDYREDGSFAKYAKVTVGITLFSPVWNGGEECQKLFCGACEALVFDPVLCAESLKIRTMDFDSRLDAYVLQCELCVETMVQAV